MDYESAIIVNEIITTLATGPSDEEWRCIREFKRRTRELAENSLLKNGYDLSANVSLKAGEPPSFTVKAMPFEEPLRALLLTFRLFWANDEPSNFLRVSNILSRHIAQDDARMVIGGLKTRWNQALFSGVMFMSFNGKDLTANTVFDLWINAHYFHSELEKREQLERLEKMLSPEFVKFLLANAVTECCKVILVLDRALQKLSVPESAK